MCEGSTSLKSNRLLSWDYANPKAKKGRNERHDRPKMEQPVKTRLAGVRSRQQAEDERMGVGPPGVRKKKEKWHSDDDDGKM